MNNLNCNRFKGELKYKYCGQYVYYLDQIDWWEGIDENEYLDSDESWIWSKTFEDYLVRNYNLTGREYLNLVMTGYKDDSNWEMPDDKYYQLLYNSNYKSLFESRLDLKCKISPGEIIFISQDGYRVFVDQLDECGRQVEAANFTKYILRRYALTPMEYYNIVVHDNINYEEKCPYCNKNKKFYTIRNGYAETCSDSKCFSLIHSDRSKELWLNKSTEERNKIIDALQSKGHEYEAQCLASYTKFMNSGDPNDEAHFYIALNKDGIFKFGVCTDIRARVTRMGYKTIHILVTDTRYHVAELEYWIKFNMKLTNEYLDESQIKEFNTQFRLMYQKIYKEHFLD